MQKVTPFGSLPFTKRPSRSMSGTGSMKSFAARTARTWLLLLVLTGPSPGLAQQDNTGTNPANFTYDFRLITEMWARTE